MTEISTTHTSKRVRRSKIVPLTAEELAPIKAQLREAYRLVGEVGSLIRDRVKPTLESRHRDMQWEPKKPGDLRPAVVPVQYFSPFAALCWSCCGASAVPPTKNPRQFSVSRMPTGSAAAPEIAIVPIKSAFLALRSVP